MRLGFSSAEEGFRGECAAWLDVQMTGDFADIRGIANLTDKPERRRAWEQRLARDGWSCIGWPRMWGGRDATVGEQVIFAEEYARAGAPNRLNHIGVELLGPTLLALRHRRAKGAAAAAHRARARNLVPGLFRTRCGVGPVGRPHPRAPRRRRLGHRRAENLDQPRPIRGHDLRHRPHPARHRRDAAASASWSSICISRGSPCGRSAK